MSSYDEETDTIIFDKMKPEDKAVWLAALRGDKYQQGTDSLRPNKIGDDVEYCCLGVLCDTIGRARGGFWIPDDGLAGETFQFRSSCSDTVAPEDLRLEVNLDAEAQDELTHMNDSGKTFTEIADWIEAHL